MLKKLFASIAVVGAAASVAGLGTFATFTSSASVDQAAINTGSVSIALGTAGPANRLAIGASGLVPGDTMQRVIDLQNTGVVGSDDLASASLTTAPTAPADSSLLDQDAVKGLQLAIDSCSVSWTEAGPPYTYTCSGTTKTVLAQRALVGSNMTLSNLASLSPQQTDHLRLTLSLPAAADNPFQGLSTTITYTFTGTQRTPGAK